jgi:hypothetical protein
MEGRGRLSLPSGDEYAGLFVAGRREGRGIYTDATGAIYEGGFEDGLRDGAGIFVPARGEAFSADWLKGNEVAGTRRNVPDGALPFPRLVTAEYADVPDLRLGLVAERRPKNLELDIEPMSYTSRSDGASLEIFPDDQRLMDVWRGGASIELTDEELNHFASVSEGYTSSFLGYYERFEPLSLVFSLENTSTQTVGVVGGFIDVSASARDPEPAVQLRKDALFECSEGANYRPSFFLDNYGWTGAENATLTMAFAQPGGAPSTRSISKPIGALDTSTKVDINAELAGLGVDVAGAAAGNLQCSDAEDKRLCLGEIRQSGLYGELSSVLGLNDRVLQVDVTGSIDYDWQAADGSTKHKTSPFRAPLMLGTLPLGAECGEGGEIIPVKHEPFMLKLDSQNYKIAVPFSGEVTPGFMMRWRMELEAPETSAHDFHMVLVLADGRQVASRPVHLTYFNPPHRELTEEMMGY